jgi:hypothetical protein
MSGFDITETIPIALAARAVATAYGSSANLYDVNIGGLPFNLAIKDDQPYVRETNDYKRQQLDTSPEPGEQTLSQWWVRDQDSWHRGGGITYYEPGSDPTTRYRFKSSVGVDVWTKGQATLLKAKTARPSLRPARATPWAAGILRGCHLRGCGRGVLPPRRHDEDGYTGGAFTPATEPAVAGAKVLVGATGGVMMGDATGSTLSTLYTDAASCGPGGPSPASSWPRECPLRGHPCRGGAACRRPSTPTPIRTSPGPQSWMPPTASWRPATATATATSMPSTSSPRARPARQPHAGPGRAGGGVPAR